MVDSVALELVAYSSTATHHRAAQLVFYKETLKPNTKVNAFGANRCCTIPSPLARAYGMVDDFIASELVRVNANLLVGRMKRPLTTIRNTTCIRQMSTRYPPPPRKISVVTHK